MRYVLEFTLVASIAAVVCFVIRSTRKKSGESGE